jgi:hypothetical protein
MNLNEKVKRSKAVRPFVGVKGIILRVRNIKNVMRGSGLRVKATVSAPYGNGTRTFIPNPQPCGEKLGAMRVSSVGDDFRAYPTTPTMRLLARRGGNLAATQEIFARLGRDLGTFDAPIVDVTAEPVTATENYQHKPVEETNRSDRLVKGGNDNANDE